MKRIKVYTVTSREHTVHSGADRWHAPRTDMAMPIIDYSKDQLVDEVIEMQISYPILKFGKNNDDGERHVWYSVHTDELKQVMAEVIMTEEQKILDMQNRLEGTICLLKHVNKEQRDRLVTFNHLGYLKRLWKCLRNHKV